ncbi:MAG: bifunctional folylpolyglutamate synthase/dihydrofolate synthase [Crocinitomicaceae bacterium]|nr:bifunctional folylpolyglutamate synthase/dihydrofolate synthase [Crocinitomicaceae bacterium]
MPTYKKSIDWLFQQFPNYQKQGKKAYKADLTNISKLLSLLNLDNNNLKFVHVAGTNGKGSVCCMLASTLSESGYKTGLFTSPHLLDFRERIRINGSKISKEEVISFCEKVKNLDFNPSFFEITFAMAIEHFVNEKCDICIIEVGLGGRLDATNIITPILTAITSIGLDHTDILGNSLSEIAKEKAGIIKKEIPLVLGEKNTTKEIMHIAKEKDCLVLETKKITNSVLPPFDYGYPFENAKTAFACLKELNKLGFKSNQTHFKNGLKNIQENTGYKARLEILKKNPTIIFDGGHNVQGIEQSLLYIKQKHKGNIYLIYGSSKDKDHNAIFNALPKDSPIYLSPFKSERSLRQKDLIQIKNKYQKNAIICKDVNEAILKSSEKSNKGDCIFIFGSFFLYEEILK